MSGHACLQFHQHSWFGPSRSGIQCRKLAGILTRRHGSQTHSSFGKIARKGLSKKNSFYSLKARSAASDTGLQTNGASKSTREGASTDLSVIWSRLVKVRSEQFAHLTGNQRDCIEVSTQRMYFSACMLFLLPSCCSLEHLTGVIPRRGEGHVGS